MAGFFSPSVFAYGKATVPAAASVGASASQRCPPDTRTPTGGGKSVMNIVKLQIDGKHRLH